MTRKLLALVIAGGGLVAGGASLAGSPEPAPVDPVIQPVPVAAAFDWTGGYAGLQFGLLSSNVDTTVGFLEDDYEFGKNVDGTALGIYGGYNWQFGTPWVYGVEAEYNWVDGDDDDTVAVDVLETESKTTASIDATGALRGRVGYAWDRALLYGTLGLAYVDYEVENEVGGASDSSSADNWGWTAGVGFDYAFTDNWIGRIDYRYSDYDGDDGSWYEDGSDYDIDLDTSELRVGVAYRF